MTHVDRVLEGGCTEPNRAACPRRCIDFCNKAETEKAVAGLPAVRAAMCQDGCNAQVLGDAACTKRCAVGADGVNPGVTSPPSVPAEPWPFKPDSVGGLMQKRAARAPEAQRHG